jgi:hypothetical protein
LSNKAFRIIDEHTHFIDRRKKTDLKRRDSKKKPDAGWSRSGMAGSTVSEFCSCGTKGLSEVSSHSTILPPPSSLFARCR